MYVTYPQMVEKRNSVYINMGVWCVCVRVHALDREE